MFLEQVYRNIHRVILQLSCFQLPKLVNLADRGWASTYKNSKVMTSCDISYITVDNVITQNRLKQTWRVADIIRMCISIRLVYFV